MGETEKGEKLSEWKELEKVEINWTIVNKDFYLEVILANENKHRSLAPYLAISGHCNCIYNKLCLKYTPMYLMIVSNKLFYSYSYFTKKHFIIIYFLPNNFIMDNDFFNKKVMKLSIVII